MDASEQRYHAGGKLILNGFSNRRTFVAAAALAMVCVTVAFGVTLALQQFADRAYFILFVPAVMFSTWFGGLASGIVASGLTVAAAVFLVPPGEVGAQLLWLIVAGVVTVFVSAVTASRRRVERLLTARAAAEESRRREAESLSQLKTDVLAQVAHELRQPLSAISAAARLIETPQNEDARQRAVGVVRRQTDHLHRLIDDLLDLSKLTRRDLQLLKSDIDLCQVVGDSVHDVTVDVAARGVDLSASLPSCPVRVVADPTRVRQILSNLLSNAIKFTPGGGRIDLSLEATDSHVVIRVRDTGRGISPDRLPHIFEMFRKDDGDGLGVGLAVVKGLAEMHGGTVEARSDGVGQGSEFVVVLPLEAAIPAA